MSTLEITQPQSPKIAKPQDFNITQPLCVFLSNKLKILHLDKNSFTFISLEVTLTCTNSFNCIF